MITAIAMVGLVGTVGGPITSQIFANVGTNLQGTSAHAGEPASEQLQSSGVDQFAGGEGEAPAAAASDDGGSDGEQRENAAPEESPQAFRAEGERLLAERSIWPMVLFAGIALMIGVALLRWILVPRAG